MADEVKQTVTETEDVRDKIFGAPVVELEKKETEEEEEEEIEDNEEEDDNEEEEIEDLFGVTVKPVKKEKIKLDFDIPTELNEVVKKKFGVEDIPTFLSSAETWREQAQEGAKIKEQYESIIADLNSMPPNLSMAIQSWVNGEDYAKVLDQQRLDFNVSFEKQDKTVLVQHYLSEDFQEEKEKLDNGDSTPEEFKRAIELLSKSAKKLFEGDKQSIETQRVQYESKLRENEKKLKQSSLDSVKSLRQHFPLFNNSEVDKIQNVLLNKEVDALLYNPDGTYKIDAAKKTAFIMFGDKMLEQIKKQAEKKGEGKARREVVDNSDRTIKANAQKQAEKGKTDEFGQRIQMATNKPDNPFA